MTIDEIKAAIATATEAGEDTAELEKQLAEAEAAAKPKGTDLDKNGKKFSQAEVDGIVKSAKAAQAATHKRAIETLQAELETERGNTKSYSEILDKVLVEKTDGMPDATKKLLSKLDPLERYNWVAENGAEFEQVETPLTPRAPKKPAEPVSELANKPLV